MTSEATRSIGAPMTAGRRRRRRIWKTLTQPWFIRVHRWTSLAFGLLLLLECTSGVVLLYESDYSRWAHPGWYAHTAAADPIGPARALHLVQAERPELHATSVQTEHGVYVVSGADVGATSRSAFVDPGTGRITAVGRTTPAFVGLMTNLHDCMLGCEGSPGYIAWVNTPIPHLPPTVTVGTLILGVLGVLLMLLAVTGAVAWWPGIKRFATGFTVRRGRGGYVRDLDLHRVVGLVAVPFLFMWGVSGVAIYFQWPAKALFAVAPGSYRPPPAPAAPGKGGMLKLEQAQSQAMKLHPEGEVRAIYSYTPEQKGGSYGFRIAEGFDSYRYAAFAGSVYVEVDSHGGGVTDFGKSKGPAPERFWYNAMDGVHFGSVVPAGPRIVWALFGLTPALLGATGVTVWLTKRRSRDARRRRRRADAVTARDATPDVAESAEAADAADSEADAESRAGVVTAEAP